MAKTSSNKWGFVLTDPEAGVVKQQPNPPSTAKTLRERVAEDGTLQVFSKKSERQRKKLLKRGTQKYANLNILDLPFDVLIHIVSYLRPSDVFRLSRTCWPLHDFLLKEYPSRIARSIIQWRYSCLAKCIRLPVLVSDIEDVYQDALRDQERLKDHNVRRRPYYQHVKPPDPDLVCTCLTCVLRWNVLGLAVDFSHWQDKLDANEPLPMIPRGRQPEWNTQLLDAHAAVVEKAIFPSVSGEASSLWYAVVLEAHLDSTVRAVRRHSANKFNQRKRFLMTPQDAAAGTDEFLQQRGPPSLDFPFHRDNYYMLEAYLPNRSWFSEDSRWGYMPADQHDKDIEQLRKWVCWRRARTQVDGDGKTKEEERVVMEFNGSGWEPVLEFRGARDHSHEKLPL